MRILRAIAAATIVPLLVGGAAFAQDSDQTPVIEQGYLRDGATIEGEPALVVRVVDGDTILVDRGEGVEAVQYIGSDAREIVDDDPELQPIGFEAFDANVELVGDMEVLLERDTREIDRFGRLLRYVWVETDEGTLLVNYELVRRGLADLRSEPPDTRYDASLSEALAQAKAVGAGKWPEPTPEPSPTPVPTIAPIDYTLKKLGHLRYRWLDNREYECGNELGCAALLVRPGKTCSKELEVTVAFRNEDGKTLDTVTKSARKVKKGKKVRFKFVNTSEEASQAYLTSSRCLQKP